MKTNIVDFEYKDFEEKYFQPQRETVAVQRLTAREERELLSRIICEREKGANAWSFLPNLLPNFLQRKINKKTQNK